MAQLIRRIGFFLLPFLMFFCLNTSYATHNRAGEITYEQIGDKTIIATITTYTKESSIPADRDSLMIDWGDGSSQWVVRANGNGESLPNDTKKNIYVAEHTYAGQAHYIISMTDPNRNGGILNVNPPNSDNVQFHIETTVTFFNPQFQGYNSSPILLQPPIDIGCVGQRFIHNPNAYDPDGDSLSYHLIVPLQEVNTQVPDYYYPNEIEPGGDNNIDLNEFTGDFIWDAPQKMGEYNIALIIVEYRNGFPIDTMIRDMQILIEECDNRPPEIETINEICVIAGEIVEFDVIATDPDMPLQLVELTALGGPFVVPISPAEFDVEIGYQEQPNVGVFRWETACEHISDQYYSVVFKAVDDYTVSLATLETVRIKVVGPPPEDVQAEPGTGQVEVTWEKPYSCEETEDDYFQGFSVWRREGSNTFQIDTCTPGLDGRGYTKIFFDTDMEVVDNRYYYLDLDVERGRTYCYRILAEFAKVSAGSIPFNRVESLPSEEICVQLSRDIPLITNVSVLETNNASGEIEVRWSKPDVEDLDTLSSPGPYVYELYRATGMTTENFELVPGATFTSNTFAGANDTVFIDTGLNTVDNAYSYKLAFYVNNEAEPLGFTNEASSVYLTVASTDETNNLTWEEMVPWDNYEYVVYRQNINGTFDSIGLALEQAYSDEGLLNGQEYCYYIKSIGSYGIDGVVSPIFNDSQEACGIPLDTIPPCPPELTVSNICDIATSETPQESFINDLSWINPNFLCPETDDVVYYNVYYAPNESADFSIIETTDSSLDTFYMHQPDIGIAGCYAVTAVDTFFNESAYSNIICVDNCPIYTLPNVFTPNGDGANDLFLPFPYRFIDRIDIKIFNRWGQLIFETADPDINWDGKNLNGKEVDEGVYFYNCRVFENRVTGITENPEILQGYIELIRGQ